MKIKFAPKIKFTLNLGLTVNLVLALLIAIELYFAYSVLYKNLNPEAAAIVFNKIVSVNLSSYESTTKLIESRQAYTPQPLDLKNPNPFRYNQ